MTKKTNRKMEAVGESQKKTEQTTKSKFDDTQPLAHGPRAVAATSQGRVSPQLSCTILPEDKQLLNEITVFAVQRTGKAVNTSSIIRALIRLGHNRKGELEF